MCQGILLAAACVDKSGHLALLNAGDEKVVSKEEGDKGGVRRREGGGWCCCASAVAIAHMRAHRARDNSTRLGRVALTLERRGHQDRGRTGATAVYLREHRIGRAQVAQHKRGAAALLGRFVRARVPTAR